MSRKAPDFVLAYDADCGPCSQFKGVVEFLDTRRRIRFVSLEAAESSGLLSGLPPASRFSSFHLIRSSSSAAEDEVPRSGSEALLPLMRLLSPWGRAASRILEGIPGGINAVSFAYTTLSRLHRVCSLEPTGELLKGSAAGNQGVLR